MKVLDRFLKRETAEDAPKTAKEDSGPMQDTESWEEAPENGSALKKNAEDAARYLLEKEKEGALRYDMQEYVESRDFAELMSKYEISAAVRIYEAERFADTAYQAGRDDAIEEIYRRREMPKSMRTGMGSSMDTDYSRMSSEEFSRLRERLSRG